MTTIDRNSAPTESQVNTFLDSLQFSLPTDFISFFKEANGADITKDSGFILLWPLTDMVQLNKEYDVEEYAPEFFIFGSDGGDMAYAIDKTTGYIFEMPFIGMSKDEAIFKTKTFTDFVGLD